MKNCSENRENLQVRWFFCEAIDQSDVFSNLLVIEWRRFLTWAVPGIQTQAKTNKNKQCAWAREGWGAFFRSCCNINQRWRCFGACSHCLWPNAPSFSSGCVLITFQKILLLSKSSLGAFPIPPPPGDPFSLSEFELAFTWKWDPVLPNTN